MGNNFSSKYELFRNVKADDKKGLNKNYGIFLVLRRKTGMVEHLRDLFLELLCLRRIHLLQIFQIPRHAVFLLIIHGQRICHIER